MPLHDGGGSVDLSAQAKQLRKSMTPEEVKLWLQLKHFNRSGYHFRRQAPVDGYILDFVEFTQRLIIEVDGSQHAMPQGEIRDRKRDQHFTSAGFVVLRFWNVDINQAMNGVIDKILSVLKEPPPSHTRHLPRKGGG